MLKIDTEKIWKLLKKDKKIQKELAKYIKEERDNFLKAQAIYQEQLAYLEKLKQKREKLNKDEKRLIDKVTELNGEISLLEIKKIFAESRIKKLRKLKSRTLNRRKRKRYTKLIKKELESIHDIIESQNRISGTIEDVLKEKDLLKNKQKDLANEIDHCYDTLSEDSKMIDVWKEEVDTKTNRFYQTAFEEVSQNFQPCQDLVVPDLEESKKMSKVEAKKKANPIVIDQEYILSSPEQLRVRRLTKDEKDEYHKSA